MDFETAKAQPGAAGTKEVGARSPMRAAGLGSEAFLLTRELASERGFVGLQGTGSPA